MRFANLDEFLDSLEPYITEENFERIGEDKTKRFLDCVTAMEECRGWIAGYVEATKSIDKTWYGYEIYMKNIKEMADKIELFEDACIELLKGS